MIWPTGRAVALVALGAPLALVAAIAAPDLWAAGLVWPLMVGALAAVDAVLAAGRRDLAVEVEAPPMIEVGETAEVGVRVRFPQGAPAATWVRVDVEGPLTPQPATARAGPPGQDGVSVVRFELPSSRRGEGRIVAVWTRWRGPLGLTSKQRVVAIDRAIGVVSNVSAVKKEALRLFSRDALFGQKAQFERGDGSEFDALREWRPGMDRRSIDWKQSGRHQALIAKEYRTERNHTVVLAIDSGRLMAEPVDAGGLPKLDVALSAALLLAYVSLKLGDRVRLFAFDERPKLATGAVTGAASFPLLQRMAAGVAYSPAETNFTLGLTELSGELERRSLVVVFTDFVDPTSAELMIDNLGRLMKRHLVLFVTFADAAAARLMLAEPVAADDVSRAVIAHTLMAERSVVLSRLSRLGALILEAPAERMGVGLLNQYLGLKARERL